MSYMVGMENDGYVAMGSGAQHLYIMYGQPAYPSLEPMYPKTVKVI